MELSYRAVSLGTQKKDLKKLTSFCRYAETHTSNPGWSIKNPPLGDEMIHAMKQPNKLPTFCNKNGGILRIKVKETSNAIDSSLTALPFNFRFGVVH